MSDNNISNSNSVVHSTDIDGILKSLRHINNFNISAVSILNDFSKSIDGFKNIKPPKDGGNSLKNINNTIKGYSKTLQVLFKELGNFSKSFSNSNTDIITLLIGEGGAIVKTETIIKATNKTPEQIIKTDKTEASKKGIFNVIAEFCNIITQLNGLKISNPIKLQIQILIARKSLQQILKSLSKLPNTLDTDTSDNLSKIFTQIKIIFETFNSTITSINKLNIRTILSVIVFKKSTVPLIESLFFSLYNIHSNNKFTNTSLKQFLINIETTKDIIKKLSGVLIFCKVINILGISVKSTEKNINNINNIINNILLLFINKKTNKQITEDKLKEISNNINIIGNVLGNVILLYKNLSKLQKYKLNEKLIEKSLITIQLVLNKISYLSSGLKSQKINKLNTDILQINYIIKSIVNIMLICSILPLFILPMLLAIPTLIIFKLLIRLIVNSLNFIKDKDILNAEKKLSEISICLLILSGTLLLISIAGLIIINEPAGFAAGVIGLMFVVAIFAGLCFILSMIPNIKKIKKDFLILASTMLILSSAVIILSIAGIIIQNNIVGVLLALTVVSLLVVLVLLMSLPIFGAGVAVFTLFAFALLLMSISLLVFCSALIVLSVGIIALKKAIGNDVSDVLMVFLALKSIVSVVVSVFGNPLIMIQLVFSAIAIIGLTIVIGLTLMCIILLRAIKATGKDLFEKQNKEIIFGIFKDLGDIVYLICKSFHIGILLMLVPALVTILLFNVISILLLVAIIAIKGIVAIGLDKSKNSSNANEYEIQNILLGLGNIVKSICKIFNPLILIALIPAIVAVLLFNVITILLLVNVLAIKGISAVNITTKDINNIINFLDNLGNLKTGLFVSLFKAFNPLTMLSLLIAMPTILIAVACCGSLLLIVKSIINIHKLLSENDNINTDKLSTDIGNMIKCIVDSIGGDSIKKLIKQGLKNTKKSFKTLKVVVGVISDISKTIIQIASSRFPEEFDKNGTPIKWKVIDTGILNSVSKNIGNMITSLVDSITGITSDKLDILEDCEDAFNVLNILINPIKELTDIITNLAAFQIPMTDDNNNILKDGSGNIQMKLFKTSDLKDAGKNIGEIISGFVEIVSGIGKENLKILEKGEDAFEALNILVNPIKAMTDIIINLSSLQIPYVEDGKILRDANGDIVTRAFDIDKDLKAANASVNEIITGLIGILNNDTVKNMLENSYDDVEETFNALTALTNPIKGMIDIIKLLSEGNYIEGYTETKDSNGNIIQTPKYTSFKSEWIDTANTNINNMLTGFIGLFVDANNKNTTLTNNLKNIKSIQKNTIIGVNSLLELMTSIGSIFEIVSKNPSITTENTLTDVIFATNIDNMIDNIISTYGKLNTGYNITKENKSNILLYVDDYFDIISKFGCIKKDSILLQKDSFINIKGNINDILASLSNINNAVINKNTNNSIMEFFGSIQNLGNTNKGVVAEVTNDVDLLFTKVNSLDLSKLKSAQSMMQAIAQISKDTQGNFSKIAEAINENLINTLKELKEVLEGLGLTLDGVGKKSSSYEVQPSESISTMIKNPGKKANEKANIINNKNNSENLIKLGELQKTLDNISRNMSKISNCCEGNMINIKES